MLACETIYNLIRSNGFEFFTGVPDSLLKDFCAYVSDNTPQTHHIITANEGNAVALATGHFLSTGKPSLVYMQNSGIGNAVNPLTSMTDPEVYSIPMLLMIGWRGEPGVKDEPQHIKQGRVMTTLLDALEIPWFKLDDSVENPEEVIAAAIAKMNQKSAPVALLVSKNTFSTYKLKSANAESADMLREEAIEAITHQLKGDEAVVSTTGMSSRELFEIREKLGQGHDKDFLTVGAMGHTSSIALGLSIGQPSRKVVCIDGDGSCLMHMGSMPINAQHGLPSFTHFVLNNGAHDSVGGQPTVGKAISLCDIAKASGYAEVVSIANKQELDAFFGSETGKKMGPTFIEVQINKGARKDLGRPTTTPIENKRALMRFLGVNID